MPSCKVRNMTPAPGKNGHRIRTRHVFFVAGILFAGVLVWYLDPAIVLTALRSAAPGPLVVTVALTGAGFWIRAWKWRYVLGRGRQAVGLFFIAKMAGHWSPGRIGELSPLLLRRHRNTPLAAWILADRAIEISATLFFGLFGVAAMGLVSWWLALLLAAAMTGAGVIVAGVKLPERTDRFARVLRVLTRLQGEFRQLGAKSPVILLTTSLAKVSDILGVVFLCRAFGYPVSFVLVCVARCAHAIVSGIPVTPDATGIPFAAAGYFLHTHGGMPVETLVAAFAVEVAIINAVLYLSFFAGMLDMRQAGTERKDGHDDSGR